MNVIAIVVIVAGILSWLFGLALHGLMITLGVPSETADYVAMRLFLGAWFVLILWAGIQVLRLMDHGPTGVRVGHGSANFMSEVGTSKLTDGDGLIVGRDLASGRLLRFDGEAHLITIAPTRSGKGVGTIIPNLLTYAGPIVCIDPKGENARVSARHRAKFGPVHVLDPFAISGIESAKFNPLDAIDPDGPDGAEEAASLADALVYDPPGQVHEAHWNEEAKALIAGILLHLTAERDSLRTLGQLRHLLTLPQAFLAALLDDMAASEGAGGLVARAANRHLSKADREAAGVLSSAQRHTHFLDSTRITSLTERSTFDISKLGPDNGTLFIAMPPDRLAQHSRWLRLMVVQIISALTCGGAARRGNQPVLMLMDEFASLGRLEPVARAMSLMAGYGLRLWPILQDIHQLRSLYGLDAGSFLSNAGCVQVFNVSDIDTAEWVSRTLGDTSVHEFARSEADDDGSALFEGPGEADAAPFAEHIVKRPLLTPDEVRRLPRSELILLPQGQPPIRAAKVRYFADHEFDGLFDANL